MADTDTHNSIMLLNADGTGEEYASNLAGAGGLRSILSITNSTEDFAGQAVTVSIPGGETVTGTFGQDFTASALLSYAGTYQVTCGTASATVTIAEVGGAYSVDLISSSWKKWAMVGGAYKLEYASLDDILADEKAIRRLMTIHASVDWLANDNVDNEMIASIINSDICAKWINLRDYALDKLYANEYIAALMDEADKYFYGEWALVSQVPKMTSNTAPYGEVSAKDYEDYTSIGGQAYYPWKAFADQAWVAKTMNSWIQYKFANPVCINQVRVRGGQSTGRPWTGVVKASNDGTNWVDATGTIFATTEKAKLHMIDTTISDKYLYYRLEVTGTAANVPAHVSYIQLYAWRPKGNVPVMTANDAPYGTASAYQAFDQSYSTTANGTDFSYNFTNPVSVRKYTCRNASGVDITGGTLQGSNDGSTWTSIPASNEDYYLYYRVHFGSSQTVAEIQFYGRELKVSVPKMTSNTEPWGEVLVSSKYPESGKFDGFRAFNANSSSTSATNVWASDGSSQDGTGIDYIGYDFKNPVKLRTIVIDQHSAYSDSNYTQYACKLQGFDGSDWIDLASITVPKTEHATIVSVDSTTSYCKYRLLTTECNIKTYRTYPCTALVYVQFYGLDYSEYDWDESNQRHYIYDHGIEPNESVGLSTWASTATLYKEPYKILINCKNAGNGVFCAFTNTMVDFNRYKLVRVCTDNDVMLSNAVKIHVRSNTTDYTSAASVAENLFTDLPNNNNLDVSSINDSAYAMAGHISGAAYTDKISINEWWLE